MSYVSGGIANAVEIDRLLESLRNSCDELQGIVFLKKLFTRFVKTQLQKLPVVCDKH